MVCGAGVRVDTWVESGTEVTPFYDSLLGKLMVHGASRPDAIAKMTKALAGTVLGGIPSNLEYLSTIIASEGFHAGQSLGYLSMQPVSSATSFARGGASPLLICLPVGMHASLKLCLPNGHLLEVKGIHPHLLKFASRIWSQHQDPWTSAQASRPLMMCFTVIWRAEGLLVPLACRRHNHQVPREPALHAQSH